ncbi:MAG: dTMP kinase [Rhodospirillaceae bacterium]|nr:dTMP kinase [Rhodospirillaceae bacterium]
MPRGRLITLEGGEGAGKSTQIRALTLALKTHGVDTAATREPGGTPEGEAIRALLLDGDPDRFDGVSQALLHFAARREHLRQTILPLLDSGTWVLCDRFADSTMAYQGYGAGLGRDLIEAMHRISIGTFTPDLTVILDLAPEQAASRLDQRNEARNSYELLDQAFHDRVRAGFLDIARREPERCLVVDASLPEAAVTAAIFEAIEDRLGVP